MNGEDVKQERSSRIILLGAGTSSSIPLLSCLMQGKYLPAGYMEKRRCPVCIEAAQNAESKNYRGNPSLLIQIFDKEQNDWKNILIDAGKTFLTAALRFFPKFEVKGIDSLLITHDHADAVFGIDDLRCAQYMHCEYDESTGTDNWMISRPIDVYCSHKTLKTLQGVVPYLMPKKIEVENEDEPARPSTPPPPNFCFALVPFRFVAKLSWKTFDHAEDDITHLPSKFSVCGLEIQPVSMFHGGSYICYGFIFGPNLAKIAYLSDVKKFPGCTLKDHDSHLNLIEAVHICQLIKPRRAILVGMSHEFDYYNFDETLQSVLEETDTNLNIEMGYDGMSIDVHLPIAD
eukprot:gene2702-5584_t